MKRFGWALAIFLFVVSYLHSARAEETINMDIFDAVTAVRSDWYTPLENLAQKLRTDKMRDRGGAWVLQRLYEQLTYYKYPPHLLARDEAGFNNTAKLMDEKLGKKPNSMTLHIAAAKLNIDRALDIKDGYTSLATPQERHNAYLQLIDKAEGYLKGFDPKSDPEIYLLQTHIGLAHSVGRDELDALFKNATQAFPDFLPYYTLRANYLRESAWGKPGDLANFLASLSAYPGGETGDIAYAVAASAFSPAYGHDQIYSKTGLQWAEVQKTFDVLEKKYGLSDLQQNALASLAVAAKDRPMAEAALKKLKKWDPAIWKVYDYYKNAIKWLNEKDEAKAFRYWSALPYDPWNDAELKLMTDDFDWIENAAKQFRSTDARSEGGGSMLHILYGRLGAVKENCLCLGEYLSSYSFDEKLEHLNKWLEKMPQSTTAHIAIADAYVNYGESARGRKYASEVSDQQWQLYRLRLGKAVEYLKDLDRNSDPMIYSLYSYILRAGGYVIPGGEKGTRMNFDDLYAAEIKSFPSDFEYYTERALVLQEKWFGKPGELGRYLKTLSKIPGRDNGTIALSFVVDFIFDLYVTPEHSYYAAAYGRTQPFQSDNIIKEYHLTWAPIKKSYELREQQYGLSNYDWNRLLDLAISFKDAKMANQAVGHITDMDTHIWRTREIYDASAAWAYNNKPKTQSAILNKATKKER